MEWIATMQQAIAYMEEHLLEKIYYECGRKGLFCELWIPVKKK